MNVIKVLLILIVVAVIAAVVIHVRNDQAASERFKEDSKAAAGAMKDVATDVVDATKDTAHGPGFLPTIRCSNW